MKPRNKQSKSMKKKTTKSVKSSNSTVHTTKIVPTVFEDLFSREVWESTYKDHNDNSVDDTLLRVAKAIASVETTEPLRNEWTDKFYDMMQGFKVIPGGRILANAGTEWKGTTLINCYVGPRSNSDIDSLDGILNDLRNQSQTLKSEGGWGQNFSFIRPRGAFIGGVGVETPGAVKFMELYDKASDIITSGSGRKSANKKSKGKIRKGAMMSVLDCSHPDIVEFVTAKQTPGRLTKFNVSVNCTDEFMKKVQDVAQMRKDGASEDKIAEMDKWELIFPETTFDKYKAEWDGDIQLWLSKKYPINVYDTVSASWLWNLIMESTYNRAEPGVLFLDRANHFNPLNYQEKIAATNPCITGDTRVATSAGLIKFEDLITNSKIKHCVSNHAPMRAGNDWKIEVRVPFVNAICNGVKDTIRLKYSNGMHMDCTPDHRIFTTEWYLPAAHCIGKQIRLVDTYSFGTEDEWCKTKNTTLFTQDENNLAFFLGCFTGYGSIDGNIISFWVDGFAPTEKNKFINILISWHILPVEMNLTPLDSRNDQICVHSADLVNYLKELHITKAQSTTPEVPKCIFIAPKTAIEQFLIGYQVPPDIATSQFVSSQLKNDLMQLCLMVGINKEQTITVTSIEQLSPQKVYDLTVPEFHNFVAGGITVHNCGEQMLAPGGICCLGSVNLVNFINDTRTDFDYQKLEKYAGYLVRFLDNVNSYSSAPLPEYKHSMKHKRRIGCGLMGWGSALLMLKTRYGSSKAADLRDHVLKTFAHATYKTSIDLAEEKGKFSLCNPKKHAAGVFVGSLDLPEAYIQKMKKVGIRNSSLLSVQPNGNSAIFSNMVSGGLEPIFMHEYIRTVIVPNMPEHIKDVTPKWFEGEWKETSMFKFTKEGDEEILKGTDKHGTTYKIDKNRGLTKEVLCEDYGVRHLKLLNEWDSNAQWAATTTQLTADDHLSELKGFARWIDSAISKTINIPHDYPLEDFKKIYLDAYNTGYIKGVTTYRSGTMTSVLSAKEDKHADQNDEEIILEDVQLPASSQATLKVLKAEGKKWYLTVAYHEHNPNRPFALFVKTNAHEKNVVADGAVAELFALARSKKIPDRHITSVENKLATDNNSSKIARLISFLLRHGVLIKNIVSALDEVEDVYVGSFVFQIKKFLSSYIKDGEQVEGETCSECSGINTIVYREGCKICTNCSSSKCS